MSQYFDPSSFAWPDDSFFESIIQGETQHKDEDEELEIAEVYLDYKPAKLKFGKNHPDPVVETASLASVEPPDVYFKLCLPQEVIDTGSLSALQLESIVYASQQHEIRLPDGQRAGFLIGDGAGVGKGRQLAGIIYDNYLRGRHKSLWFSISSDLKYDAERDLHDIGACIAVNALNKLKYEPIDSAPNGFITRGVLFSTYSSLISETTQTFSKFKSRFDQIVAWCGKDFDGLIVFDECHKAKNICPAAKSKKSTKTGLKVLELQNMLPNARVVYASATGASEVRNMAYMCRLGLWGKGTPFHDFLHFKSSIEKRGVGALEIVAMDMKLRGMYIARQLSFQGVSFFIDHVGLSPSYTEMYDKSVALWIEAKLCFIEASRLSGSKTPMMWTHFWAAHQRFFKYLCISAKISKIIEITRRSLKDGKCVVIGLQSTGEARALELLDQGDISDFVCTPKEVFKSLIEKTFPQVGSQEPSNTLENSSNDKHSDIHPSKKRSQSLANNISELKTELTETLNIFQSNKRPHISETELPDYNRSDALKTHPSETISLTSEIKKEPSGTLKILSCDPETLESEFPEFNKRARFSTNNLTYNYNFSSATVLATVFGDHCYSKMTCSALSSQPFVTQPFSTQPVSSQLLTTFPLIKAENNNGNVANFKNAISPDNYLKRKDIFGNSQQLLSKNIKEEIIEISSDTDSSEDSDLDKDDCFENWNIFLDLKRSPQSLESIKKENNFKAESVLLKHEKISVKEELSLMKNNLLRKIEDLGVLLPTNTLDTLIDELGGPEAVAEMTGRKGRFVKEYKKVKYELRAHGSELDVINLREKELFMNGIKNVAIISEAASSGISLQSDRRGKNQKKRVHITIELPWSADRAVQQFGRTHRSNQVNAPEYVFLISDLSGEKRFASIVAKRLEKLGALTQGDRRAREARDLSSFHIDNKYGCKALSTVLNVVSGKGKSTIPFSTDPNDKVLLRDIAVALSNVDMLVADNDLCPKKFELAQNSLKIDRFLNRMLGMPVKLQNMLFKYFNDTLDAIISHAIKNGNYDMGILDITTSSENVQRFSTMRYYRTYSCGTSFIDLHTLKIERGMTYEVAYERWMLMDGSKQGFYVYKHNCRRKQVILLELFEASATTPLENKVNSCVKLYTVYKPHLGKCGKKVTFDEIDDNYRRLGACEAKSLWEEQYKCLDNMCAHYYSYNHCKAGGINGCEYGRRKCTYYVLSGTVLSVWDRLLDILGPFMKIVRVKTREGLKIVGAKIPHHKVEEIKKDLEKDSEDISEENADKEDETTTACSALLNCMNTPDWRF